MIHTIDALRLRDPPSRAQIGFLLIAIDRRRRDGNNHGTIEMTKVRAKIMFSDVEATGARSQKRDPLPSAVPFPLTVAELSYYAGVPTEEVETLILVGEIDTVKTGDCVRIPFSFYERFVKAKAKEDLLRVRGIHQGLAFALERGIIVEQGVAENGFMVFMKIG